MTVSNEIRQLHMGLGQILDYAMRGVKETTTSPHADPVSRLIPASEVGPTAGALREAQVRRGCPPHTTPDRARVGRSYVQ